jgi:glycosyltransferase involved in cell wall biosynthesis
MRILNVIPSVDPTRGGTVEGLRQSVGAMASLGHLDEVLSLDGPDADWVLTFPARVHALGPVASHYGYCAALVPWLKKHAAQYDAVVVHGVWQYHSYAVWRALRGGPVPYFLYFHGMLDPWFKRTYPLKHLKKWLYWPWADYRVARDAKAVLFTALEEQRLAAQSFWLYRVTPAVVGYGLACEAGGAQAKAEAFRLAFAATRGKRIVLFLARLHPKKGCDLMIEAFARHARVDADAHLVMAGPDQAGERASLDVRATALGIADRVTWTGMLQGDLKWGALAAADVFALPSHQENFGIAVVEALAMGVPVLISECVNIWREVVADEAGFAAPDTADGMAAMLARWHALAPAARDAMRVRASACYERHFRMESAARRLIATMTPHLRPA